MLRRKYPIMMGLGTKILTAYHHPNFKNGLMFAILDSKKKFPRGHNVSNDELKQSMSTVRAEIYFSDMDGFIYPYLSGLDSEHDYFAEVCWCDDITGFGICTHKYKNSDVRGSADGEVDLIEDFDSSKWEVIGNIFDNPELLEGGE